MELFAIRYPAVRLVTIRSTQQNRQDFTWGPESTSIEIVMLAFFMLARIELHFIGSIQARLASE